MGTALDLLQDIRKFNIKDEVVLSFKRNRQNFAILQATQMLEGKNSDGLQIGHYRPPTGPYAEMKTEMNPLAGPGNVDLKLTGSLYKGIVATLLGDDISVKSTDAKYKKLTDAYGQEIWGLDDPMMLFFADMMATSGISICTFASLNVRRISSSPRNFPARNATPTGRRSSISSQFPRKNSSLLLLFEYLE